MNCCPASNEYFASARLRALRQLETAGGVIRRNEACGDGNSSASLRLSLLQLSRETSIQYRNGNITRDGSLVLLRISWLLPSRRLWQAAEDDRHLDRSGYGPKGRFQDVAFQISTERKHSTGKMFGDEFDLPD